MRRWGSYLCKRGAAERLIVPHGQTSSLVSLPPFAEHGCGGAAHRLDRWISNAGSQNSSGRIRYPTDRKSTRLNSSHTVISYAVFCLKKKKIKMTYKALDSMHRPYVAAAA